MSASAKPPLKLGKLSRTASAKAWMGQFAVADQPVAAELLDSLLLLNQEHVNTALHRLLRDLTTERAGSRKRVALYAEREYASSFAFSVPIVVAGKGKGRSTGRKGPAAVQPTRGKARVGSEGAIAFLISQAVETWPKIFVNHPGPDSFRTKRPISTITILSDFIGSGARVTTMLDTFWNVPTVKAWHSRGLIDFQVIAAAGTKAGLATTRAHRLRPDVRVSNVAPTIHGAGGKAQRLRAFALKYGATLPDPLGFANSGALIAFNYRIPNNAPAIVQTLYKGVAPPDMADAFGVRDHNRELVEAATVLNFKLADTLPVDDANIALILRATRGRWRDGSETVLAEMIGIPVPEIELARARATKLKLLTPEGRVTDEGHKFLDAAGTIERKKVIVPTNTTPYHPQSLRVPRRPPSVRRPSGRP
ncbi:MAG: hypothetical protein JNM47_08705 [Hyphomonadaceae bacterium]|nr:hypothetical protein [Hyphomonadaceae bacterium]